MTGGDIAVGAIRVVGVFAGVAVLITLAAVWVVGAVVWVLARLIAR